MVSDKPTVTTSGVVKSIAYAQDISETNENIELNYEFVSIMSRTFVAANLPG